MISIVDLLCKGWYGSKRVEPGTINSLVQTLTDRQKKIEQYWSPLVVDQGQETAAAVIDEKKYAVHT